MKKKLLLISFSGGQTSAFMTWWLLNVWPDRHNWEIVVVFANTGKEREETLEFVRTCDEVFHFNTVWVEAVTNPKRGIGVRAKVVTFETADRTGAPFEAMIKKLGIPSPAFPHCSRELKRYAIDAYLRSKGWKGYHKAIGIRADEVHRVNWKTAAKERIFYPLITMVRTTKSDVNRFWAQQPFRLRLKSYEGNCDMCWKKSLRKLMTLAQQDPAMLEWWREMETKYENFIPTSRAHNPKINLPTRFFRENRSVDDILEESKFPFEPARDESGDVDQYKQAVMWDPELDGSAGCIESCEAF